VCEKIVKEPVLNKLPHKLDNKIQILGIRSGYRFFLFLEEKRSEDFNGFSEQ